jgi:hypothetical protein
MAARPGKGLSRRSAYARSVQSKSTTSVPNPVNIPWERFRGYRRTWIVSIALLAALSAILSGLLVYSLQAPPEATVTISTITLDITYEGNGSGYLGAAQQNECSQCPIGLEEGSVASFTVFRLDFNATGPYIAYVTWTLDSTYPFLDPSSLSPNPPLVTSKTIYNISYVAGSSLIVSPIFEIPLQSDHPATTGTIVVTVLASPTWLPNS